MPHDDGQDVLFRVSARLRQMEIEDDQVRRHMPAEQSGR
jgi:hypothetical protein